MYCSWAGVPAIIGGSISMTPGIDPDAFTISVPGSATVAFDGDLVFGDGNTATDGTTLFLPDCRISDGTKTWDAGAITVSFQALDFRWKWKWAEPINGEYNRRDDSGKIVGTEKSAYDLIGLCLANLDYPNSVQIKTTLKTRLQKADSRPYVNWENANPAEEMDKLLTRYGGILCPTPSGGDYSGDLYLWEANIGLAKPSIYPISAAEGDAPVTKPEKVLVHGARNLYQMTVDLKAVGFDPINGDWRTLAAGGDSAIFYKPNKTLVNGWHLGFAEGITDPEQKKAAEDTVFKAYQIADSVTIGTETLDRKEAIRRIADRLVEVEIVDGEERYQKPYITGAYHLLGAEGDAKSINTDTDIRVPVQFAIDADKGVIIFKEPVFDVDIAGNPGGATLTLHCAFKGERYTYEHALANAVPGTTDVIGAESIYIRYIDGVEQNKTEADTQAKLEAQARESYYKSPAIGAATYVYPGIVELAPDGILTQVTWTMDMQSGPTTTASWQREHITSMPPREHVQRLKELARYTREQRNRERNDNV